MSTTRSASTIVLSVLLLLGACIDSKGPPDELAEYVAIDGGDEISVCCEGREGEILLGEVNLRREDRPSETVTVDLELPAGIRVEPETAVLGPDGTGTFRVYGTCEELADEQTATVRVYEGEFSAEELRTELPEQYLDVTIRKDPDCEPPATAERTALAADRVVRTLVLDEEGMALPGAEVTVRSLDGTDREVTATADDRGAVLIAGVPGGRVEVRAAAPGRSRVAWETTIPNVGITVLPDIVLMDLADGEPISLDPETGLTTGPVVTAGDGPRLRIPEGTTIEIGGETPAGDEVDLVVGHTGARAPVAPIPDGPPAICVFYVGPDDATFDTNRNALGPGGITLEVPNDLDLPFGTDIDLWWLPADELEWTRLGRPQVTEDEQWVVAEDSVLGGGHFALTGNWGFPRTEVEFRLLDEFGHPLIHTPITTFEGQTTTTDREGRFRVELGRISVPGVYELRPDLFVSSAFREDGRARRARIEFDPSVVDEGTPADLGDLVVPGVEPGVTFVFRVIENGEPRFDVPVTLEIGGESETVRTDERGRGDHRHIGPFLENYDADASMPDLFGGPTLRWERNPVDRPYDIVPMTLQQSAGAGPDDLEVRAICESDGDPETDPFGASGARIHLIDADGRDYRGIVNAAGAFSVTGIRLPLERATVDMPVSLPWFDGNIGTVAIEPETEGESLVLVIPPVPPTRPPEAAEVEVGGTFPPAPEGEEPHVGVYDLQSGVLMGLGFEDVTAGRWTAYTPGVPSRPVYETRNAEGSTKSVQVIERFDPEDGGDADFGPAEDSVRFDREVQLVSNFGFSATTGLSASVALRPHDGTPALAFPLFLSPFGGSTFDLTVPDVGAFDDLGESTLEVFLEDFGEDGFRKTVRWHEDLDEIGGQVPVDFAFVSRLTPKQDGVDVVPAEGVEDGTPASLDVESPRGRFRYTFRHRVPLRSIRFDPETLPEEGPYERRVTLREPGREALAEGDLDSRHQALVWHGTTQRLADGRPPKGSGWAAYSALDAEEFRQRFSRYHRNIPAYGIEARATAALVSLLMTGENSYEEEVP